jgi:hypothetical protein
MNPEDYDPCDEDAIVDADGLHEDERWCENEPDDEFLK